MFNHIVGIHTVFVCAFGASWVLQDCVTAATKLRSPAHFDSPEAHPSVASSQQ